MVGSLQLKQPWIRRAVLGLAALLSVCAAADSRAEEPPRPDLARLIARATEELLGRPPHPEELSSAARSRESPRRRLESIFHSAESRTRMVVQLYRRALNRDPDELGLLASLSALIRGAHLESVEAVIYSSEEWSGRNGITTDAQFVETLSETLFGYRYPGGIAKAVERITSGRASRREVAADLLVAARLPRAFDTFRRIKGRPPRELSERAALLRFLAAGGSIEQLTVELLLDTI